MNQIIEIDSYKTNLDISLNDNYEVKTLQFCNIQYTDFFKNFISKNIPCIVKNVSTMWECSYKWVTDDKINYDYFIDNYGGLEAPVSDCDKINVQCKTVMTIKDYMNYLKHDSKQKLLYLKDWHLRKLRPNDNFYKVPFIFASDWLNEYAEDHQEDDFMFVYIGPKNSWTPLHVDVYNSYSWSVNIVGEKKWILFPPGEEEKLKDSLGNYPVHFSPETFSSIKYFEIIQKRGDAIFVPSGWYHHVVNTLETISINHNWINGCNVKITWTALQKCLSSVEQEIEEFKDTPEFVAQCQLILKSLFGIDYASFINFLCYIAKKRLAKPLGFNCYTFGTNHIIFDLYVILEVMNLIQTDILFVSGYLLTYIKYDFTDIKNTLIDTIKNK